MQDLMEWLEAKFQAAHELYKEHYAHFTYAQWSLYEGRITEMEQRIMAAIDDLTAAVAADVAGRKSLAASIAEIGTAVTGVAAYLKDNPQPGTEVIANLTAQLATAGSDLTAAAGTLHSSAVTLEGLVPTPAPSGTTGTTTAAPVAQPVPPVVGATITIPSNPADPASPPADHTITAVNTDGSVTAQPVAGGPPVSVPADVVAANTPAL